MHTSILPALKALRKARPGLFIKRNGGELLDAEFLIDANRITLREGRTFPREPTPGTVSVSFFLMGERDDEAKIVTMENGQTTMISTHQSIPIRDIMNAR